MEYQDYVNALKGVPAAGLYYYSLEVGGPMFNLFKDYVNYLLINSDVWIEDIIDLSVDAEENKVWVNITYTFNDVVDIYDDDNDERLLATIRLEFEDSYSHDEPYDFMDLRQLAEKIVDMFATNVQERIDDNIDYERERIKEIEKEDEYQERYGIDERE